MCDTCGCTQPDDAVRIASPNKKENHSHTHNHHTHKHGNGHDHHHHHHHENSHGKTISIETDILTRNNMLAERNRGYLEAKNIFTLNLVSSPGSGKTSLLERTLKEMKKASM